MAFHLKPKEEKFFNLLDKHAALCYAAADILKEAVNEEISKAEAMEKINALEEEANDLVVETMKRLKTFRNLSTNSIRLWIMLRKSWTRCVSIASERQQKERSVWLPLWLSP